MPYSKKTDLPKNLKEILPDHAQDIYKESFNSAWEQFKNRKGREREKIAHKIAWSAVKKKYRKKSGDWVKKEKK